MTTIKTKVLVIGSGPGGYTAAFRAADLGNKVVLVEQYASLGGVCLNVGCIPSKALLHAAKVLDETKETHQIGIKFSKPEIDEKKLVSWKNSIIKKLTGGLTMLASKRKVEVIRGYAKMASPNTATVTNEKNEITTIEFEQAIIAVGSAPVSLPFIPEDPRIFTSTGALELKDIKGDLLVLGGGIIGLEMATVYNSLGVKVTVVESMSNIISSADTDLTSVLQKKMHAQGVEFLLNTKVTKVDAKKEALVVTMLDKDGKSFEHKFSQILVAVGRRPNGNNIDAQKAGINVNPQGFIPVDKFMRTNISNIYAIGDVVGQPMLAHKAIPEGKLAAEVISGLNHAWDVKVIPNVAYTDPELAWTGLTEIEAKAQNIPYKKASFPWAASGRALSVERSEGFTKMLFCPKTQRILGVGIVGVNAGELVAEASLAIEMGADAEDLALTIHPHPTLSETLAQTAEMFLGSITDLIAPKERD